MSVTQRTLSYVEEPATGIAAKKLCQSIAAFFEHACQVGPKGEG